MSKYRWDFSEFDHSYLLTLVQRLRAYTSPPNLSDREADELLAVSRWGDRITCVLCGHDKWYTLKQTNNSWRQCAKCKKRFSVRGQTIFQETKVSMSKWMYSIWLMAQYWRGLSSRELSRKIGVTQSSTYWMLERVRRNIPSGSGIRFLNRQKPHVETENKRIRKGPQYRKWRLEVLKRDRFMCVRCGSTSFLHVHHVEGFVENPELRFEVTNGQTLCSSCHGHEHGTYFYPMTYLRFGSEVQPETKLK